MLRVLFVSAALLAAAALAPATAGPTLGDDLDTCRDRQSDAKHVWTSSKHQQQPFTYGSPPGREDFYFVSGK